MDEVLATRSKAAMNSSSREDELPADKYRVAERVLGSGGMGVVLDAHDLVLNRRVAIKRLHKELLNDPETVERFLREARAAVQITSQHVVRILHVDRLESGEPYMVMEHLEGATLADLLAHRRTLDVREAVDYVLQACDALSEAHDLGIFHRDLKPGNLFLTRTKNGAPFIKVLDFGISKMTVPGEKELTRTFASFGTPSYMSPEQHISARSVDGRSDIWSLGCVLYKLLTGSVPFRGGGEQGVAYAVLYAAPTPPRDYRPDLPLVLQEIILRCLEKLPEKRFPSVDAFASELRAALERIPPTSPSPPPLGKPSPAELDSPQRGSSPASPGSAAAQSSPSPPVETAARRSPSLERPRRMPETPVEPQDFTTDGRGVNARTASGGVHVVGVEGVQESPRSRLRGGTLVVIGGALALTVALVALKLASSGAHSATDPIAPTALPSIEAPSPPAPTVSPISTEQGEAPPPDTAAVPTDTATAPTASTASGSANVNQPPHPRPPIGTSNSTHPTPPNSKGGPPAPGPGNEPRCPDPRDTPPFCVGKKP